MEKRNCSFSRVAGRAFAHSGNFVRTLPRSRCVCAAPHGRSFLSHSLFFLLIFRVERDFLISEILFFFFLNSFLSLGYNIVLKLPANQDRMNSVSIEPATVNLPKARGLGRWFSG